MSNEVDRKGKGKAKDQNQHQNQSADESEDRQKQGEGEDQRNDRDRDGGQQQMKEIRRPPPLPAVKGTIGAIGTSPPISQSFIWEDLADRQNHLQDDHSSPDHLLLP